MHLHVQKYNESQPHSDSMICEMLASLIDDALPNAENKLWHGHPVWFIRGNPIVGYSKLKNCVQLLFWSGQSFDEAGLGAEGSFKAAQARFTSIDQIDRQDVLRWLNKARSIQWDYKNIVKKRGVLSLLHGADPGTN